MSLRSLMVLSLALAVLSFVPRLDADEGIVIEGVRPDKILYGLNEDASAKVILTNKSAAEQSGTLIVTEFHDIDQSRSVGKIPVTLIAGESGREVVAAWNVGPWMYGREVRVEFETAGKVISSASEYYHVADLWLRVNIVAGWNPGEGLPQDLGLFETYNNHGMQFAWAPCDFSDMTPDTETWYSGQARYPKSIDGMKADMEKIHSSGNKISTYGKYTFCGPAGFEFARRHPEWVARENDGSFFNYSTPFSPLDLARPLTQAQPFWQYGVVDFSDPAAVEFGARQIADSAKTFNWDGVMFDGHFTVPDSAWSWDGWPASHGKNSDKLSARNVRLCREIVRREFPNFAFWYNGGYVLRRYNLVTTLGASETMNACLEDPNSGMLVETQGPGFMTQTWRHHYDSYADQPGYGEVVRKYSSPVNSGWLWNMDVLEGLTPEEAKAARGAWVAAHHMGSIFLAFNIHPCWNTSYASRPFTQFMTRYSALLWDTDIKRIEAEKFFGVQSERELWWKKAAYVKRNEGETLYLVHLLNTPTTEKPVWKIPDDPPAASGVQVTFKAPGGESIEKAWALRPYEWGEENRNPVRVELEMEKISDGVKVKIPDFHYYTLVVFKLAK